MIWTKQRIMTLASILLAAFGATMTFLCIRTWAALYLPGPGAVLMGLVVALAPGYLVNRSITRAYQKTVDVPASQLGSLFGCTAMICLGIMGALSFGAAGLPGRVSVTEAFQQAGSTVGLLPPPGTDPLDAYPESTWDGRELLAPNVGTAERPRLLLRRPDGRLELLRSPRPGQRVDAVAASRLASIEDRGMRFRLSPLADETRDLDRRAAAPSTTELDLGAGSEGGADSDRGSKSERGEEDRPTEGPTGRFFFRCRDGAVEIGGGGGSLPRGMRLRLGPTTTEIDTR